MVPATVIAKKRDGHALSADEIREFVAEYSRGRIPDYQMAALAMAIVIRGMDASETAELTRAMLASGHRLGRGDSERPRVDKHSTGGLGDKVSLILAPLLACCGADVPMISGRGLGLTGGTLDKLEAIPGFEVDLSAERAAQVLAQAGCFIIAAGEEVAPADRRLYALRDVTATVESVPLITASILSKKLAEGLDALIMDVKVGSAAFMKTTEQAVELAESLLQTADQLGTAAEALLTDMDQPLGNAVGGALEVNEALEVLQGSGPAEVRELTLRLAMRGLVAGRLAADENEARRKLTEALDSGAAWERFSLWARLQGGRLNEHRLPVAPRHPVVAERPGYLHAIDCQQLGACVVEIGGGRRVMSDAVDPTVGLEVCCRIGERVEAGEPIAWVHARSGDAPLWAGRLSGAFSVSDQPVLERPLVLRSLSGVRRGEVGQQAAPGVPEEHPHTGEVSSDDWQRLVAAAINVRERAYAPYSRYRVGAALLADSGQIHLGCNVENASYGVTLCAERAAGAAAVARGDLQWSAMAVATAEGAAPCGMCRQWIAEFAPQLPLVLVRADSGETVLRTTAQELLPGHFRLEP